MLQDQVTKDMFAGDEEEHPSADDDLAPSYTSNTSDLLRRLQGNTLCTLSLSLSHCSFLVLVTSSLALALMLALSLFPYPVV